MSRPKPSGRRKVAKAAAHLPAAPEAVRAAPGGTGPEASVLDGARVHLYRVAVGMAERFEKRLADPDYRPAPADLSAVFAAIRSLEEHGAGLVQSFGRLAELKTLVEGLQDSLRKAEERLLALLSSPPAAK